MSYQNLNPSDFKTTFEQTEDAVIIDVRTAPEIAAGKIEGALEIDFYGADFTQKILELDRSKTYFMVCRSGGRSAQACSFMSQNGFKEIYNLAGGMISWEVQMKS
jgi:rhodanese-related sulfurtransferase